MTALRILKKNSCLDNRSSKIKIKTQTCDREAERRLWERGITVQEGAGEVGEYEGGESATTQ